MDGSQFPAFDWKNPDYVPVLERRRLRLARLRAEIAREVAAKEPPTILPALMAYYREHPADFINDWGMTSDTRNADTGSAIMPFLLFKRQREWIDWTLERWRSKKPGLTEKSRDMGVSWLSAAFAVWACVFYPGVNVGFGSRKEEYVDKKGTPKCLFYKIRQFATLLPAEFRGGFIENATDAHMIIRFPRSGSTITGEAGDSIGRGDRAAIYFVDEAAHLEHPLLADAGLANTTNCRIDISSVKGMGNPFAKKRWSWPSDRIFIFDWREDPRKDRAWYDKYCSEHDAVIVAQEVDRDYTASVEGVVIPGAWIRSAIDAHKVLGVAPTGRREGALDVADEGKDSCAMCGGIGFFVDHIEEWSGINGDIFGTVERAFSLADEHGYEAVRYDADGLGAGVRGDARVVNERRSLGRGRHIRFEAFRGSAGVVRAESEDVKGRKNKDHFMNFKAQAWWALRMRFQYTHRAVEHMKAHGVWPEGFDADEIVSLCSQMPLLQKLVGELSQPTFKLNVLGKVVIDKTPDGVSSPNLADSVMIRFSPLARAIQVSTEALKLI